MKLKFTQPHKTRYWNYLTLPSQEKVKLRTHTLGKCRETKTGKTSCRVRKIHIYKKLPQKVKDVCKLAGLKTGELRNWGSKVGMPHWNQLPRRKLLNNARDYCSKKYALKAFRR